jgi:hypothetical protein
MQSILHRGRAPVLFTLAYALLFSAGFMYGGNKEFALYTVVVFVLLALVVYVLHHTDVPQPMLWSLSAVGMLHMAGGGMHVDGERLYGFQLIDIYTAETPGLLILKYDQLVHLLGYGVLAVIVLFLLRRIAPQMNALVRAILSILAAMAAGSLNELAEFVAVLSLPSTGVGNYFNSMLDLSFNTLGAIVGVIFYESWMRLKKRL